MELPLPIDTLEIIGYANVLQKTMLPSVVAPVFRPKNDPGNALVPPYLFNENYLCNATRLTIAEVNALNENEEVTLFGDKLLQAQPDFELWIDQDGAPHYEPQTNAQAALHAIAMDSIKSAETTLRNGRAEDAEQLCNVALCADDRLVEPLAIKAAIRRQKGDGTGEKLMAKLALPRMTAEAFGVLVNSYYSITATLPQSAQSHPDLFTIRPMRDMAAIRAAA